jgi:DnaD/phage-associated family protein
VIESPDGARGARIDAFFLNTEAGREAIAKVQRGELVVEESAPGDEIYLIEEKPNICTLYEQNIGVLTPLIAAELAEAEKTYPASWIEEAFREAVVRNKRQWRYISRILERWSTEGKDNGESGRNSKEKSASDKYVRGKYGHLVQR